MIETTLARIADALERIAVRLEEQAGVEPPAPPQKVEDLVDPPKAKKSAKSAEKPADKEGVEVPTPKEVEPTELTLDALRKSLAPLDPAKGKALLEGFGVSKLSELDPKHYMDVLRAAKEAK